jgi:hypothetical protein
LQVLSLLSSVSHQDSDDTEAAELLWGEMGLPESQALSRQHWEAFMVQYLRRNAEHDANM